jgi:hypothetical protein
MTGSNSPDSTTRIEVTRQFLVIRRRQGNMTLLPQNNGVMRAKIGFWASQPRSEERYSPRGFNSRRHSRKELLPTATSSTSYVCGLALKSSTL